MNNINDFKNDFYNLMRIEDILEKYKISRATYFNLIKKIGLKRNRTSKLLRTFNINLSQQVEQNKSNLSIKDIDETDEKLIYDKQYVPRNTKIDVEKQKPVIKTKPKPVAKKEQVFKEVDEDELNAILNKADKTIAKIQNKKQSRIIENKNK